MPSPDTLEREKDKLYVTDAELIRRLGIPVKMGKAMLQVLDRERKHRIKGFRHGRMATD